MTQTRFIYALQAGKFECYVKRSEDKTLSWTRNQAQALFFESEAFADVFCKKHFNGGVDVVKKVRSEVRVYA